MKTFFYSVFTLLTGIFLGSYFTGNHRLLHSSPTLERDTVKLLRIDTLLLCDTLRISIPAYTETSSPRSVTTAFGDTDSVSIPAVRRIYTDSTFRAVVSGIDPRLDSLTIFPQLPVITKTVTRHIHTVQPALQSRWSLGITAGATATPHGLAPGITLGLSYRLWP